MSVSGPSHALFDHLLTHPDLPTRLFALRRLAGSEEGRAHLLSRPPGGGELLFPWVWALERGDPSELPMARAGPLTWVRFLRRRALRAHRSSVRSRSDCAGAMTRAEHPLAVLAAAVRMVELHGLKAVQPLLDIVRHSEDRAACAAWALGRLGRGAVPEIVDAYGSASPRVRSHLAMALWYLGPRAARAVGALARDDSPQSSAALLAMGSAAGTALVELRRIPVWLDDASLCALATLAYGDEERRYAATALVVSYGPAAGKALPILRHLALDEDMQVRRNLAAALGWVRREDTRPLLAVLLSDKDELVRNRARGALEWAYPDRNREQLLDALLGTTEEGPLLAAALARRGLPGGRAGEVAAFLDVADDATLLALLPALQVEDVPAEVYREPLLRLVARGSAAVRELAAKLAQRYEESPLPAIRALLDADPDPPGLEALLRLVSLHPVGRLTELGLTRYLPRLSNSALFELAWAFRVSAAEVQAWLEDDDPALRRIAPSLAGRLKLHDAVPALTAAMKDRELHLPCARALVQLGESRFGWHLFLSESSADHQLALDAMRGLASIPSELLEAFKAGRVRVSLSVLHLFETRLSTPEVARLFREAYPHLDASQQEELFPCFVTLGAVGLELICDIIDSSEGVAAVRAVSGLLAIISAGYPDTREWLTAHADRLPLDHPDAEVRALLHRAFSEYLLRWGRWREPPLQAIVRGLLETDPSSALLRRLLKDDDVPPQVTTGLLGLLRASPARTGVLRALVRSLPGDETVRAEVARQLNGLCSPTFEDARLRQSLRFQLGQMPREELDGVLRSLVSGFDFAPGLFEPDRPSELLVMASFLADSDFRVAGLACQKLLAYRGPLEQAERDLLVPLVRKLDCWSHVRLLIGRWPCLVWSALDSGELAPAWLDGASPELEAALSRELGSDDPAVRAASLRAAGTLRDIGGELLVAVRRLFDDPSPEIAHAARDAFTRMVLRRP